MLIYKQRYKPRTTREFTKSDLTVYDSAGNTALNALTVYGKSEVVDGAIKSAGEGYAVVRLADLTNWEIRTGTIYQVTVPNIFIPLSDEEAWTKMICNKYSPSVGTISVSNIRNKCFLTYNGKLFLRDDDYTTVSDFVASLGDATLCYELIDPTQGNAIAVKTDDGSGINGTMSVFSTGTPHRGIPDTDVRDVMAWDGSAGTVTKNCGKVDLSSLEWVRRTAGTNPIFYASVPDAKTNAGGIISATAYTKYPNTYASNFGNNYPDKSWCMSSQNSQIYFRDDSILTEADFATAMSGVMLVYELAIPTTEQLTPTENNSIAGLRTFSPQTHAQNNAGADMTVDYTIRVPTI